MSTRKKKKSDPEKSKSFLLKLRENLDALVFALFVAMFFRTFVVELYQVPTGSMTPTLMGDYAARIDLNHSGKQDIVLFDYVDGEYWALKMLASAPFAVIYHPSTRTLSVTPRSDLSLERIQENFSEIFHPVIIKKEGNTWELASPFDFLDRISRLEQPRKEYSRIIINKFYYWFKKPHAGDVMMFKTPAEIYDSSKPKYIKRIAAAENILLEIRDNHLYLDGSRYQDHPILYNNTYFPPERFSRSRDLFYQQQVRPDHFFALGDNSSSSWDSRYWGDIPQENIGGKALFCFWPPQNIGFLR